MPASTTALTVTQSTGPAGVALSEQDCDVSPGNNFVCRANHTMLYVRNASGAERTLIVEADKYGAEVTLVTEVLAIGEERFMGPFDAELLDHGATEEASNGRLFIRPTSGGDGDIKFAPFNPHK